MTDPVDEAFEWLEAHMEKQLAVIPVALVNALLDEIETMRQDKRQISNFDRDAAISDEYTETMQGGKDE